MNPQARQQVINELLAERTHPGVAYGLWIDAPEATDFQSQLWQADLHRKRHNDLLKAQGKPLLQPSKLRLLFEKRKRLRAIKAITEELAVLEKQRAEFMPKYNALERQRMAAKVRLENGVYPGDEAAQLKAVREDRELIEDIRIIMPRYVNHSLWLDERIRTLGQMGGIEAASAARRRQTAIDAEIAARTVERDALAKRLTTREREIADADELIEEMDSELSGHETEALRSTWKPGKRSLRRDFLTEAASVGGHIEEP